MRLIAINHLTALLFSIIFYGPGMHWHTFYYVHFLKSVTDWLDLDTAYVTSQIRMKVFKSNNFQFWTFIMKSLLSVQLKELFS